MNIKNFLNYLSLSLNTSKKKFYLRITFKVVKMILISDVNMSKVSGSYKTKTEVSPTTVAQHVAHPLVVGDVIGSNLGSTMN